MLIFSFLTIIFLFLRKRSIFSFSIFIFIILSYYFSILNISSLSSLFLTFDYNISDELSLIIIILLFFIIHVSFLYSNIFKDYKLVRVVLFFLWFFCFNVFSTCHLFNLYFFYEASLIPILYIIVKWGSYPERSTRVIIMLSYTLFFRIPFFIIIFNIYFNNITWFLPFLNSKISVLSSIFIFLCFAVKLPIYGIHYWLPMAHVEAPTFGSVILARILLKLGGVGLIRLLNLIDLSLLNYYILSYFIFFTIFRTIICCFQSDLKRLIAYSSVSHIMVIPFLVLRSNILSLQTITIIMLFHGLRSTLLFIRVGLLYSIYNTRILIMMRGLLLLTPFFRFLLILIFFFTLSAPPFPSYVAEVYFLLSTFFLSPYILAIYIPFIFLGLLYNLNWLRSLLFRSSSNISYCELVLKFNLILPLLLTLIMSVFFIPLFLFF